jgi:ATP synthase F1 delta subunit
VKEIDFEKLFELSGVGALALEEELYGFKKAITSNYELGDFLYDLRQSKEAKKKIVTDVFPGASKMFHDVISLIIDEELCRNISEISRSFGALVANKKKIRFDELVFSEKPTDELLGKFKKIAGERVRFKIEIDPSIMGGFIWKTMDGRIMDASIAGRLSQMKEEIAV